MIAALRIFLRWRSCIRPALLTLMSVAIAMLQIGTAHADPLAQWQWKNPMPQGNSIRSVAFGISSFVAVGDTGTIVTSPDGTAWTSHKPTGFTSNLKAVAYGRKKFIAVGAAGTILSSPDGSIWSDLSANFKLPSGAATKPNLNAITYGNNQFYVAGDGGTLLSSSDGVTWTNNTNTSGLTSQNLNGIVYSNYSFVAVGDNGTVLALMNQGAWQLVASKTVNGLNAVASNRSTFVAVGASGTIITSPDGVNWTLDLASPTSDALNGVSFGTANFVATGANGTLLTWDGDTLTPSHWQVVALPGTSNALNAVAYGGSNLFAVVGSLGMILTAPDPPLSWTKVMVSDTPDLKSIAFGNNAFVAVGSAGSLLYSADGVTWVAKPSPTAQNLNCVVYGNDEFVALGDGGVILRSFDGQIWSLFFSGTGNFNAAVFDSRPGFSRFVGVGDAGAVVTSLDGVNWTPGPAATLKNLKAIVLGDNLLVAVGQGGVILTSPDGVTWTSRSGVTKDLSAVTVAFKGTGVSAYVAVGALGTIFSSTDGVKWSSAKALPAAYKTTGFNAVSCDFDSSFSTFLAVGNGGAILASSDGQTWTERLKVTANDLLGVAYINRSYWAVSSNGTIINSNRLDNFIAVSATRSDTGQVISADGAIDFGFVDLGKSSFSILLKIANTGQTGNLNISSIDVDPGEFSQVGDPSCGRPPTAIAPGGTCTVVLSFKPLALSPTDTQKSANLVINSDDSATPHFPITLTGYAGLYLTVQHFGQGEVRAGSNLGSAVAGLVPVQLGQAPAFFMFPGPVPADSSYYTLEVTVDGLSLGPLPSYSFAPIVASDIPRTLQAFFSSAPHSITATVSTNGDPSDASGGSLFPPVSPVPVTHGSTQPFAIQPKTGYHLNSLLVDGASVPVASLYTFTKVTANHTLTADFRINSYSISASAETNGVADSAGTGGSLLTLVTPALGCTLSGTSGSCKYNSNISYSITPKPGYRLADFVIDGASVGPLANGDPQLSFSAIADNHSIKVVFTNQFDISVSFGGVLAVTGSPVPNGTVTPAPNASTGKVSATSGQNKTFSIVPNDGYDILDVKAAVGPASLASLGPVASYTFTNVQQVGRLDASFVPKSVAINVSAGPGGTIDGDPTLAQVAAPYHGTRIFRMVPDDGYEVADVLVDGVSVSAVSTYVFSDLTKGHTIEARFRGKPRFLVLSSDPLPAATPPTLIAGLSFRLTLPARAVLALNPDPKAPLGEVDPAALTILPAAAGSKFVISLPPAAGVAAGEARVVLVSGPGFASGVPFLKIAYTSTDPSAAPPGVFSFPAAPDENIDQHGTSIPGGVTITASSAAAPSSKASLPGGLYNAGFNVGLSATPVGPEVHYRVDGLDPTDLSTIYKSDNSVPIQISAASTTLKYFALDRSTGNREPIRTEIYRIDKTVPVALLTGVPPALTRLSKATLQVGGRDVVSYKYLLDSAAKLSATTSATETLVASPILLGDAILGGTPLADGIHKLQVIGKDAAGNWQSTATTAQWSVDTKQPGSTVSPPAGIYNAPISVKLSTNKSSAKIYYTLDGTHPKGVADGLGNIQPSDSALLYTAPIPVSATKTLTYFALDPAGNAEPETTASYTLLLLTVDTPLSPTSIADASPVLQGTVTPGATVQVVITRGTTTGLPQTAPPPVGNRWSYDIATDPDGPLLPGLNSITVTANPAAIRPFSKTVQVRVAVLPCAHPDGDIDRDGQVSMTDVNLALQMVSGLIPQDPVNGCGDVEHLGPDGVPFLVDGVVGVNDALLILQKVMGFNPFLP